MSAIGVCVLEGTVKGTIRFEQEVSKTSITKVVI